MNRSALVASTLTYEGRTIARAVAVVRDGINLRISWSTGYDTVHPASGCDATILSMLDD